MKDVYNQADQETRCRMLRRMALHVAVQWSNVSYDGLPTDVQRNLLPA
jgi:hypothetical protein